MACAILDQLRVRFMARVAGVQAIVKWQRGERGQWAEIHEQMNCSRKQCRTISMWDMMMDAVGWGGSKRGGGHEYMGFA